MYTLSGDCGLDDIFPMLNGTLFLDVHCAWKMIATSLKLVSEGNLQAVKNADPWRGVCPIEVKYC